METSMDGAETTKDKLVVLHRATITFTQRKVLSFSFFSLSCLIWTEKSIGVTTGIIAGRKMVMLGTGDLFSVGIDDFGTVYSWGMQ